MTLSARTNRPLVIVSVMLCMAMVAIEATIVSTAMPQIVTQLGDIHLYSWVFSAFLLAQTAMTVVFGKLSDLYGRKPTMLAGILIFLVGSILSGFSWSLPSLIVFRLIQGVGAGAIQPLAMTIVADLYAPRERGRVQGYLASVWATAAVLGPMIGGVLMHQMSWSWIFWINIPIALLAIAGFLIFFHEEKHRRQVDVDSLGAALFTVCVAALMVAMTAIGTSQVRNALYAALVCIVSMFLFVWQERRAKDPMMSFSLWTHRPIAIANAAALGVGMVLMGLTSFVPMYVQGVLHRSPITAGLALTMIMLGWPIGATFTARTFVRYGLRRLLICGSLLLPVGAAVFALLTPASPPVLAGIGSMIVGLGMGVVSISSLLSIQEIVDISQRGVGTASNLFARNLGSTLGTTLFGAVLNYGLTHSSNGVPITSEQLRETLEQTGAGTHAAHLEMGAIEQVLQHSLHLTFSSMWFITVVVVALVATIPPIVRGSLRVDRPVVSTPE